MAVNLDALIKTGYLPWAPNEHTSELDVWAEYEQPIVGTFTSGDARILFSAIGSVEARITVWAYTCLNVDEASNLQDIEFESIAELRQLIEDMLSSRRIVLAMAVDLLIEHWSAPEDVGSLDELAVQFLQWVLDVKTRPDPHTKLRAAQAQLDAATAKLVEA